MLITGVKASRTKAFGVLMITMGVAMMALDSLFGATPRQLLGDACLLMASICWAGYGIYARKLSLPPIRTASIVAVFSMTCFLPIYFFMPGKAPFMLPLKSPALYYLQRLRDEAHRFANGAHAKRRSMDIKKNPLDEIEGVGPGRKKALLHAFGSAKGVGRASVVDLEKVEGINRALAERIHAFFRKA